MLPSLTLGQPFTQLTTGRSIIIQGIDLPQTVRAFHL